MVRRNVQTAMAIAIVAIIGILWALPVDLVLRQLGPLVASVAGLLLLSLVPVHVGVLRAPPETGLAYLAHRLRLAELRVAEEPGRLKVRIGPLFILRFDAIPAAGGCQIRYRWEPSPVGWTGYLLVWGLVLLLVTGIPALLIAVRLRWFDAHVLAPIVPTSGDIPPLPEVEPVRARLVDGLSECRRLAEEAYEATRTAYWDWQGIVILAGVLMGALFLLGSVVVLQGPDAVQRLSNAIPFAVVAGIAAAAPLGFFVRRRIRPRVLRYREWARRLRADLLREVAGSAPPEGGESSFETLLAASREVPEWVEAQRRAGLSADLGMWSLFFIVLGYEVTLLQIGVYRVATDPSVALVALGATAPFAIAIYFWWRLWARRQREAAERQVAAWNERFDAIRSRMESYLRDL